MIELLFSVRNLCRKRVRCVFIPSLGAFMSMFAISISIAMLIIVTSVMNGFTDELISKILGFNSHITVYSRGGQSIKNFEEKITDIKNETTEPKSIIPVIYGQGMVFKNNETSGVLVKGFKKNDLFKRNEIIKSIEGKLEDFDDGKFRGLIGIDLAAKLGVRNGDIISLVVPSVNRTIFGSIPRYKDIKIAGIINSGTQIYDSAMLMLSFGDAQLVYGVDGASAVEILLKDISKTNEVYTKLLVSGNRVSNWKIENSSLMNALNVEANVMGLILGLFVLTAMFTIFATMNMMVNEKEREIAILKSHGVKNSSITRIFFFSGFFLGIAGMLLGNLLGVVVAMNVDKIRGFLSNITGRNLLDSSVYLLSYLPSKLMITDIININIFSFIMAVLCAILPARKASKKEPAEILRWL